MTEPNNLNQAQWDEPTPKTRRQGKGPLWGLLALVVIAAVGIGLYASGIFGGKGGKDEDRVSEALVSLIHGEDNPFMEDWIGTTELTQNMVKAMKLSGRLELVEAPIVTDMTGFPIPGGIALSFAGSTDGKASAGSLGLGMMGTDLVNGKFYMDETKIMAAAPALFQEVLMADYSGDLEAKLKNAPLFKDQMNDPEAMAGIESITKALTAGKTQQDKLMKLFTGQLSLDEYPGFKQHTETFKSKWVITRAEDKKQTWNGQDGTFDGFTVTVPKTALVEYLKNLKTYVMTDPKIKTDFLDLILGQMTADGTMTEEAAQTELGRQMDEFITGLETNEAVKDVVFTVHMTDENVLISLVSEMTTPEGKAAMDLTRSGGAFPNENMVLKISAEGADAGSMEVTSTGKTEAATQQRQLVIKASEPDAQAMEQTMELTLDKTTGAFTAATRGTTVVETQALPIAVTMKGKLQGITKAKAGTMVLDEMKIVMDGDDLATLKGEMSYDTQNITVAPLEGTMLDLMTATQEDMDKIGQQIEDKLGIFLQLLDSPLGF